MYNKIRRNLLLALLRSPIALASSSNTPDSRGELSGRMEMRERVSVVIFIYQALCQDRCE